MALLWHTTLLVALVALLCAAASASSPTAGAVSLLVRVNYPSGNLNGARLYLRGSNSQVGGLSWTSGVALSQDSSNADLWTLSLSYPASLAGSQLQVKSLVSDSTWQLGANDQFLLPSASGSAVDLYPWFYSNSGDYVYPGSVYSPQLNNTRELVVYRPPSYLENTLKVYSSVLVMHDGQNLFNESTSFDGAWFCQKTVDLLVIEGHMREIVIVGVYNTPNRINEYTYSYDPSVQAGGEGDLYLDFLEQNAIPFAAQKFRIDTSSQADLGILGSSLGGLISCYAGYTRPSVYSKAGCMSSSFWWNSQDFNGTILEEFHAPASGAVELYLDSGNAGPDNDDETETVTVRNRLETLGFALNSTLWYYLDNGGQHNEYYWGQRFWVPMTELYPVANLPLDTTAV